MQALISPNEAPIFHVVSWDSATPPNPIVEPYPNSCRVAQVEPDGQTFPVADPLFWTPCADNVVADRFYYDTVNKTINPVVNAPQPAAADQPAASGSQNL
jgi:hypothetical protein